MEDADAEARALATLERRIHRTMIFGVLALLPIAVGGGFLVYDFIADLQLHAWGAYHVGITASLAAALGLAILWNGSLGVQQLVLCTRGWRWCDALAAEHRISPEQLETVLELRGLKRP